jgi:dUTPase
LGYAIVKNGLSQKGVLSINTGIVDSGWCGPIGSTVINFGRDIYPLKNGEIFLRMSFPKFNSPDVSKAVDWKKSKQEYIKDAYSAL